MEIKIKEYTIILSKQEIEMLTIALNAFNSKALKKKLISLGKSENDAMDIAVFTEKLWERLDYLYF